MQVFTRRGFQLRNASLETRFAYTCFLLLMLPAVATVVALSVGRSGPNPHAIAAYYRGGESEMSFPKSFWQLMEVSHFHLFTIPVVVLILSHLLYATPFSVRLRIWLTAIAFSGAFLDALGPWMVRYVSAACVYALMLGWALLGVGLLLIVLLSLLAMWGPEGWVGRLTAGPSGNGDLRE
jgi:hypothetical protein